MARIREFHSIWTRYLTPKSKPVKHIFSFLFILLIVITSKGQIPDRPNLLDADSLRTGEWVILYDSAYTNIIQKKDSARYYCLMNFEKGKPKGKVICFYASGIKQWDGQMLSLEPEIKHGVATFYHKLGNVSEKVTYINDSISGIYESYYENGRLQARGEMQGELAEGIWEVYYDNGQLNSAGEYVHSKKNGEWTYYHDNGRIQGKGNIVNDQYEGSWVIHYPSGAVEEKSFYQDGKLHGPITAYYENGNFQKQGYYKNGLENGFVKFFHENGKLESEGEIVNGLYQGKWDFYYANGNIASNRFYVDDKEAGHLIYYYEEGGKKSEGPVKNDEWDGEVTFYHFNGNVEHRGSFFNKLKEGTHEYFYASGAKHLVSHYMSDTLNGSWMYYNEDGVIAEFGEMRMGKKSGPWEHFYDNGQLNYKGPYKNGVKNGYFEYYNENGTPRRKGKYLNDTEEGYFEYYFENGQLKSKGDFIEGERTGHWKYYHDNGNLSSEGEYIDGYSEGDWVYYYSDGSKKSEGPEHLEKGHGYWKYYYESGVLEQEGERKEGNREGLWKYYHPNGNLNYSGMTKNGNAYGVWEYFDSLGRKDYMGKWKDNLQDSTWVYYDTLGRISRKGLYQNNKQHGKWIYYKNGKKDEVKKFDRGTELDFWSLRDSSYNVSERYELDLALQIAKAAKKEWKKVYNKNEKNYHSYWRMMGHLYNNVSAYDRAIENYERALEEVGRVEGKDAWNYAISLGDLGDLYYNTSKYKKAIGYYSSAVAVTEAMEGKKDPSYFYGTKGLYSSYAYDKQYDKAYELLRADIQYRLDSASDQHEFILSDMFALGEFKYRQSEYDSSLLAYHRLLDYQEENEVEISIAHKAYRFMAYNFNAQGKDDSTIYYFKKAIESHKTEGLHASVAFVYNYSGLADLHFANGRYAVARQYGDTAVAICEQYGLERTAAYIEVLISKAKPTFSLYYDQEAYDLYKKAIDASQHISTINKNSISDAYQGLALCEKKLFPDQKELAEKSYKKAIEVYEGVENYHSSLLNAHLLLGDFYRSESRFEEAKQEYLYLKKHLEKQNPPRIYFYAEVNEALGRLSNITYAYDSALIYYDVALEHLESDLEYYAINYCDVLRAKADVYTNKEQNDQAIKMALQAVEVAEKYLGKDHLQYAYSLSELAYLYREDGKYGNAIVLYKQVLELKENHLGKNNDGYVGTQLALATTYNYNNDYDIELKLLDDIQKNILSYSSKKNPKYLTYLEEIGDVKTYQKQYDEAEDIFKELINLSEDLYGRTHEDHAFNLRQTANFYKYFGKMDKALHYLLPAIEIVKSTFGTQSVRYAWYTETLGQIYYSQENYRGALLAKEEIINIYKNVYGEDSWYHINSKWTLASMYDALGRYVESEALFNEAIAQTEKVFGSYSFKNANLHQSMGRMYRWWGKLDQALERLDTSIAILDSVGVHETRYFDDFNMKGLVLADMKRFDEAKEYITKAREGALKHWGKKSDYYNYTNNLAFVHLAFDEFEIAEDLYEEASKRFDSYDVVHDLDLANFEDNLAALYLAWGKMDLAEKYWTHVTEILLKRINENFAYMSESEKANFWDAHKKDFEYFNSYALAAREEIPRAVGEMYDNQLRTKSILLSTSSKERRRIVNSGDSILISRYFHYVELKENLAKYYGYTKEQLVEQNINVDSLESITNDLEGILSLNASALAKEERAKNIRWRDIQRKLKDNEASVELIRFRHFNKFVTDSVIYAALILTHDTRRQPELVVLPNGNELEQKYLKSYKSAIRFKLEDELSYENFWRQIDEKIQGKSVVYFAPDGVFSQININTLVRPDGSYILDSYNLKILTSTRDVVLLEQETKKSFNKPIAALFGFPQYDLDHESIGEYVAERSLDKTRTLERDIDLDRLGFSELPGTKIETESIEEILEENEWQADLFIGHEALEEQLKAVDSPDILHIATHGFFLDDVDDTKKVQLGVSTERGRKNPMLRSGLLMAGAAQTAMGQSSDQVENGIFTAYEAMNLDLNDTELVVLSACETGRGEVKSGEGVYGLQRAFQVAGTKTLIMSLWKVNDEATQSLMTNFYTNWIGGMSKSDAFTNAQQAVRSQFDHPYYWGAFVMVGQ